ncbi:MAG: hypothetical protein IPI58_07315 [Alphaproteobacteria bacterium]|nr:MAG: hypothetical protein IPI58_07315 [Alphaproteobacteria bacterium]
MTTYSCTDARPATGERGIAIGPILFILALMGVVAAAMGASTSTSSANVSSDRIANIVYSQAELIRAKIHECYSFNMGNAANNYPTSAGAGTAVRSLTCPGDQGGAQNLWTGIRAASLGPVPPGFDEWLYVNAGSSGGRCIRIQPTSTASQSMKDGLARVVARYAATDIQYTAGGATQRIVIWITPPTGSADANCAP